MSTTERVPGVPDSWYTGEPTTIPQWCAARLRNGPRLRYRRLWDRVHVVRIDDPQEIDPERYPNPWCIMGATDGTGSVLIGEFATFGAAIARAQKIARRVSR